MMESLLLLLFVPIFFSFTSDRKQKRQILNDIALYKEWVIKNSRFDLTHEELMSFLDNYFSARGYRLESTGLNELNFVKNQEFTHRYKVHQPSINREVVMVETIVDGISTWHKQTVSTPYDETIAKTEKRFEPVRVSLQFERLSNGYKINTQKHNGHEAICDFNSNDFRESLYLQSYGSNIPLLKSLIDRINVYNASASNKSKIYLIQNK